MLSPVYATMDKDRFEFLPESTNAVEAYNQLSKTGKVPRPLSVVLISLYKKDMVAILQYLAETEGMATTYDDRAPAARKKRAVKANAARRKRRCHVEDDALGPPDRNSDFHPSKKRKTTKKRQKTAQSTKFSTTPSPPAEHPTTHSPPSSPSPPAEHPTTHSPPSSPSPPAEHPTTHSSPSSPSPPAELVVSRKPCLCRSGCGAKKRCSCRQLGQPCLPWCHPAVESCCNEGLASEADPVVDIDNVRDVKSITPWVIIGNGLDLLPEDKQVILSGQWLNCRVIFSWQFLLKQERPQVGGLQPTFGRFQPQKGEMVQVLNSGGNHWVAVSNIGCSPGRVQWLDSLHGSPSLSQQRIVADLLQATVDEIVIETRNVQKQLGGSDCGLFALAFITAVLNNQDPTKQPRPNSTTL